MLKKFLKKINPLVIKEEDAKVINIIEVVLSIPGTDVVSNFNEVIIFNKEKQINILVHLNHNFTQIDSQDNFASYHLQFVAVDKIKNMILEYNKTKFKNQLNQINVNKYKLTFRILEGVKEI